MKKSQRRRCSNKASHLSSLEHPSLTVARQRHGPVEQHLVFPSQHDPVRLSLLQSAQGQSAASPAAQRNLRLQLAPAGYDRNTKGKLIMLHVSFLHDACLVKVALLSLSALLTLEIFSSSSSSRESFLICLPSLLLNYKCCVCVLCCVLSPLFLA